jgi:Ca2+-binding EF-hand superfamily protein
MMRRARLMKIFKAWDKKQDGTVDLKELRAFTGKHGGNAVSRDELKDIFMDMDESGDSKVDEDEFLKFFSLSVKRMDDDEFEQMIKDMLQ